MKNRSGLFFLAVGILAAAPAFADKIPNASIEGVGNSVSVHGLTNGTFVQDEANSASRLIDSDEDGKVSIMNELLRSEPGKSEEQFIDLGLKHGNAFGKGSEKDRGKHNPPELEVTGPSLQPVAVPEPEPFMLMLLGLGVLGMILYRRNSL